MTEKLIAYQSKNGTTKKTISRIQSVYQSDLSIYDLSQSTPESIDLSSVHTIYIACGIYAASLPKEINHFIRMHQNELATKRIVFLIHGLASDKEYIEIVENSVGISAITDGARYYYLGGALDYQKLNLPTKLLMRAIAKKRGFSIHNMNLIHEDVIKNCIQEEFVQHV